MTSRRKRNLTPFSLFAFQDIITSVTGIVIVIVLLLTLELVEQPIHAENLSAETYQILNASIETVQQQLVDLRGQTFEQEAMIREVAKTSRPELKKEISNLQNDLEKIHEEIILVENAYQQLEINSKKLESNEKEQQIVIDELKKLEAESARLKSAIEQVEAKNRVVFSVPKGHERDGWLVVVDEKSIQVAPFGRRQRPIIFHSSGSVLSSKSAVAAMKGWIADNSAKVKYLLFVIRPRGVLSFDELEPSIRQMKIEYGFDLIADDELVLDPEKGAVP